MPFARLKGAGANHVERIVTPSRDVAEKGTPMTSQVMTPDLTHGDTRPSHDDATRFLVPVGRALFSAIFIMASIGHFTRPMVDYAASHGVPMPGVLVPLSGVMALAGGLSVLLGVKARAGAALIALFLIPVTLMMHRFWTEHDPMTRGVQQAMFLKNLSMLGGACLLMHFGAGPFSVDARHRPDAH